MQLKVRYVMKFDIRVLAPVAVAKVLVQAALISGMTPAAIALLILIARKPERLP